jgi:Ca-activated chloride channel homolog
MTEMTGGRVFPVGNLGELPDIAAKIGMELRNQYVLGYKPSNAQHNGTWRKIKVKLRPPKGPPSPQRLRQDRILRADSVAALAAVF